MNGMKQGDFLLDLFDEFWNSHAIKKTPKASSKVSRDSSKKSRSLQEGERIVPPVISMEGEGIVPPVISMEGEGVIPPVISMEGEGVIPPVISMEGEGVVPPVISMEGPPEEPVAEEKSKRKENAVPKRTEEVPCSLPLPSLAREMSAPNGTERRAWLTQAVVAKELLSTPAERRKARHERMMRRLHRQRGE